MNYQLCLYQRVCYRQVVLCLTLLFGFVTVYGQSKPSFIASKSSGCVPLYVQFNNTSDKPAESWEWTFGIGAGSTQWEPGKIFDVPGTYTVTLTVKYAGRAAEQVSQQITVYKNPVAAFTPSVLQGCTPLAVTLTDRSVAGDGTISKVTWDFGDGTSGEGATMAHTYTTGGRMNISNIVTNSYGCTNGSSQVVEVQDAPEASFSSDGQGTCQAPPYDVRFFNTTKNPGGTALTYEWNFGDGTTSAEEHPQHTYQAEGLYTVTLTAKTSGGCTHTIRQADYIAIQKIKPDFVPAKAICTGSRVTLTNTTQPRPRQAVWTFPDGSTQQGINATYTFSSAGDFPVKMLAIGDGCQEEITKMVHVEMPPTVGFTATPNTGCAIPSRTQFTAQTGNAVKWYWSFGDGTTSTEQNPLHVYQAEGNYTVTLVATNAQGCSNSLTLKEYIQLKRAEATISPTLAEGCLPFEAAFTSRVNSVDPVASYKWDFGDGGSSTDKDPKHTYTTEGNFVVTLEVTTVGGCKVTTGGMASAGRKPVVDFDATPKETCQPTNVQFTNLSQPRGTSWYWSFVQDGTNSYDESPSHQFQHYGNHDVALVVKNYGCVSTLLKKDFIKIYPPVSRFRVINDCNNKLFYRFVDESEFGPVNPKSWKWDFGDGSAVVTDQSPSHTYAQPGQYTVVLTVSDGHCESVSRQVVNVIDEHPTLTVNANSACIGGDAFRFMVGPMQYGNILLYRINFGDGTVVTIPREQFDASQAVVKRYSSSGRYNVYLEIVDANQCTVQSPILPIVVNGVKARFTVDGQACKGSTMTFKDASSANAGSKITNWTWRFADGTPDVDLTTRPENYPHSFQNFGQYPVRLVVTDENQCKDSVTNTVDVATIRAVFSTLSAEACLNKDFSFFSTSQGATKFKWDFGDGGNSTAENPVHQYQQPGQYSITLTVTNGQGCEDHTTASNYILVGDPRAAFSFPTQLAPCPPVLVSFTNNSTGYVRSVWEFGDGSTSPLQTPTHAYNRPGDYPVTLTVYTEGGCANAVSKNIHIQGPDGKQTATPKDACLPTEITMRATATNAVKYIWDFDDGTVLTSTTPSASYTYPKEGVYYPRVILEDNRGCQVPALGSERVLIDKVLADFVSDATLACGGGVIRLTNKSSSVSNTKEGHAMSYAWDFGVADRTDDVSTATDPQFRYDKPGNYTIKLVTTSAFGCKAETTLPIKVAPQPVAEILPITPICAGYSVRLQGRETGNLPGTQWTWQVGDGQPMNVIEPPRQTISQPGIIPVKLTITNPDGTCPNTANATITVHAPPRLNLGSPQNVCLGSAVQLQSNTDPGTRVTWTNYQISDIHSLSPRVSPLVDTVYHVLAESQYGCTNEATVRVTVTQPHKVQTQNAEMCNGKNIQLHASGATRYQWIPAEGLSRSDVADPIANPAVTTTYVVVGFGRDACFTDTARAVVTVRPSPQINAGPDMVVPVGSEIRIPTQGSPDITRVQWQPATGLSCTDCLQPLVTPKTAVTYLVTASNQYGCVSKDDITIKLVCQSGVTFLPNTFTPNGDGQNDVFYIRGRGIRLVKVFRIFNRWGQVMFERGNYNIEDMSMGWDGKINGQVVNPEVFIYYAELVCDTGEIFVLKGNVTVLK